MIKQNLQDAPFDPELFRQEGHKIIDLLSDYLKEVVNRPDTPVLPRTDLDELANYYSEQLKSGNSESFTGYIRDVIDRSNHLHHPRYIGH